MTRTVATLEVSAIAFCEISDKLRGAGYDHLFMADGSIDMYGIGIAPIPALPSDAAQAPRFFVYDPENGLEEYATDQEREKAHAEAIEPYLDDGWSEEVENVVSGVITHVTLKNTIAPNPGHTNCSCDECHAYREAGGTDEWSEICNYHAAPVAPAAPNCWQDLYTSAMDTLAPAFDYIQSHQDQFDAKAGDCKMAIIAETFPRLASVDAAKLIGPAAAAPAYDGNHIEKHCPECNEYESECSCVLAQTAAQPNARAAFEAWAKPRSYDLTRCSPAPYAAYRSDFTNGALAGWFGAQGQPPLSTESVDKPVQNHAHADDLAVDAFAAAMKEKLARARTKGRGGWQGCDPDDLSRMLREHVAKGDPLDVANFCAFLWNLKQPIAKATLLTANEQDAQPVGDRLTLAAINALRSYEYGNASPDLAKSVADRLSEARAGVGS